MASEVHPAIDVAAPGAVGSSERLFHGTGTELEGIRRKVFLDRYSVKDPAGNPTERYPEEMWDRVARGIAAVEPTPELRAHWARRFYEAMRGFKFVPGGRILAGAGTGHRVTYYNCFAYETPVHTRQGIVPIGSLSGEHEVLSEGGVYRRAFFRSYGHQRLWAVTLSNGTTLYATAEHQWVVTKPGGGTRRVTTRELKGQRIPINPRPAPVYDAAFAAGVRHGIVFGDGSVQYGKAHVCLFGESEQLASWFDAYGARSIASGAATKAHVRVQGLPAAWKQLPGPEASPSYWRGFVAGLIAAAGHVDARGSVAIYHQDATILARIAEGMASAGLVASGIALVRETAPFDGSARPLYRLQLFRSTLTTEDLLLPSHRQRFEASPKARQATIQVVAVQETDRVEEVYCCVEPETHTITVGHGYLTGQCYVIPSPEDSRGGILDNLKIMTEIMARGGGVGINLSTLRPKGSYIRTVNGTASGPCSWAELYSVATGDVIQQGGSRRGALMLMLNDDHPDIEEFITVKQDRKRILHANLSVCISDAFMEAVKQDLPWNLVWNGEVKKTVSARYLWNLICTAAHDSAEPGLHFIDRSNKRSNTWYYEQLISTNPCVTGDTLVATETGYVRARDLRVGMRIRTPKGLKPITKVYNNGLQRIYRVAFSDGGFLDCTADHKLKVVRDKRYEWVAVADLQPGDKVLVAANEGFGQRQELPRAARDYIVRRDLNVGPYYDRTLGLIIGAVLGDGTLREVVSRNSCRVAFGAREEAWLERFTALMEQLNIHTRVSRNQKQLVSSSGQVVTHAATPLECYQLATLLVKLGLEPNVKAPVKAIPEEFLQMDREFLAGILDGLFSTDGSVLVKQDNPLLRFHTASFELAQQVRLLLLRFGIHARVYRASRDEGLEYDGRPMYGTGEKYDVVVMNEGIARFYAEIGLSHPEKATRLKEVAENWHFIGGSWTAAVVSVEDTGREEEVYDVYEPETLTWVTNGYVSLDCGEQPLPAWGVCNLGALNLAAFVRDDGTFDYDGLAEHARVAIRFLDNVVDANEYFIPENAEAQLNTRRTGLGTMGLADALIKLKVRYGSDESLELIERIYRTIRDAAYDMSADLAAEKGVFPKFDRDKYLQGWFIRRLPEPLQEKIYRQGIRNAVVLTQAPTGTTSLLAGVSSGIEPVFDFAFLRRDRTGEHVIYHPLYKAWKDSVPPGTPKPDYFVAANDLTPEEHVRVQAKIQEYTDASISKTVNAPADHTVDQVKKLYWLAYELGLKGITYYRDGSRDAVLYHASEGDQERSAPKVFPSAQPVAPPEPAAVQPTLPAMPEPRETVKPRPRIVEGVTYRVPTPLGTAFVTVNRNGNGQPFEVFCNVGKAGSDTAAVSEAIGRLISLVLRLPSPLSPTERLQAVADQLIMIGSGRQLGLGPNRVRSLPDAIGQVLAEYLGTVAAEPAAGTSGGAFTNGHPSALANGTHAAAPAGPAPELPNLKVGDLCPSCGQATLMAEEGCHKCYSCGHSEC